MTNKIQRSLRNFNRILDDDYKKLSDKYDDLKLSHKRLETLVKQFVEMFDYYEWYLASPSADYLYDKAVLELKNPLYRCRERKKGGKKCG